MRPRSNLLLLVGFGLSPLWLSSVFVFAASFGDSGAEYWNAAPWLIVASIPVCAITLSMAAATSTVHSRTQGTLAQKRQNASKTFGLTSAVVLAVVGFLFLKHQIRAADFAAEKEAARRFTEQHPDVIALAPAGFKVSTTSWQRAPDLPVKFTHTITSPQDPLFLASAEVGVSRSDGQVKFWLKCLSSRDERPARFAGTGPCG
jgi:hypothetical protein